jgi:hypothetical protein
MTGNGNGERNAGLCRGLMPKKAKKFFSDRIL